MADAPTVKVWPKGTDIESIKDEIFGQLVQYVNKLIDSLESRLLALQPAAQPAAQSQEAPEIPPPNPVPLNKQKERGSLPWFKHGVRGFLRKLWYGSSKDNPDWQRQADSVHHGRMTIQEYIQIERDIHGVLDGLLNEAGFANAVEAVKAEFANFKKQLADAVRHYMNQFHSVLKQHYTSAPAENPPTDVQPSAEPPKPPEPSPEPIQPAANTGAKRGRPPGSKNKPQTISPSEPLNPLQVLLRPRTRDKLDRKKLTKENLAAALKFLHEHGVEITSPIDVVHAMEQLASEKYKDRGTLLAMYGKLVGLTWPDDEDKILAHLGIHGGKKASGEHLTPDEIERELAQLKQAEEEGHYDYTSTEGEPDNYKQDEPAAEKVEWKTKSVSVESILPPPPPPPPMPSKKQPNTPATPTPGTYEELGSAMRLLQQLGGGVSLKDLLKKRPPPPPKRPDPKLAATMKRIQDRHNAQQRIKPSGRTWT